MQQHKLAACVWEYVMASPSDIRISSLVVCIIGSYEGGLGFKFDTETGTPEGVFRVFLKYTTKYLKWERENFLLCFSV
jgi:hypothetical protein